MWFIQQLDTENLAYNFQATLRFRGRLDVAALQHSLNEIVRRHEIFRTTFPAVDGRPFQVIHPARPAHFEVGQSSVLSQKRPRNRGTKRIRAELQKPFDVTQIPLVRWHLLQLGADESVLLHVEHHLVHDGWSFRIFLRELVQLYKAFAAGKPSPLAELSVQFADFAFWQRQWLQEEIAEPQLTYWKQKLAGCPVLALPTDRPRPAAQTYRGEAPRIEIPQPTPTLRFLGRREGATLFMTMLAAFVALLHRYTGQSDICVGSSVANRRWHESEGLIGMIVNTVVLRSDLSSNLRFPELLRQVREAMLGAFAHQDVPFEQIVQALQPERDLSPESAVSSNVQLS